MIIMNEAVMDILDWIADTSDEEYLLWQDSILRNIPVVTENDELPF